MQSACHFSFGCLLALYFTRVIHPPEPIRISTFKQLLQRDSNITLVTIPSTHLSTSSHVQTNSPETRNQSKNLGLNLLRSLETPIVAPSEKQFLNDLISTDGVTTVVLAMNHVNLGNNIISKQNIINGQCYVGKELRFFPCSFFVLMVVTKKSWQNYI